MGASVQFWGSEEVMAAAEARNCSCWGIYINRALFCKFEETDMTASLDILNQNLEVLERSGTTGIYTVKFFENKNGQPVKITEKTVCDGGQFNFKLTTQDEREQKQIGYLSNSIIGKLENRIETLEKEKAELENDDPETLQDAIIGLLKNPDQLAQLVNIGRGAIGLPIQNYGGIGNVRAGGNNNAVNDVPAEEKMQRLEQCMNTLDENDPELLLHLEKLAAMAKNNPTNFKMLLGMLGK